MFSGRPSVRTSVPFCFCGPKNEKKAIGTGFCRITHIFTGKMTSMIIDLTPHDPKTTCYHIFCLIDCILLPSLKLIYYISLNPLAMEFF